MLLCGWVIFYKYMDENIKGCGLGIQLIWQSICLGCPEFILSTTRVGAWWCLVVFNL